MPKAPMTAEMLEQTRERILDIALEIIIDEGFNNLSVRKIASRLGVTATTIYNYYTNKDELNLMIRMRGFEKLHNLLFQGALNLSDLEARFAGMIRAYVAFGRSYPSYYDIMFNLHTPKYLDYAGSDIEPVARQEKENALRCLSMFMEPIEAFLPEGGEAKQRFVLYKIVRFWSDLHGLVTLCNSRLLHEVLENVEDFIEHRIRELVAQITELKRRIDQEETLF